MRVGSLRRIGAYLLDIIPILTVLSLLFTFLVGDILKPDNYDTLMEEQKAITLEYNDFAASYQTQLDNEDISQTEYDSFISGLIDDYNVETLEHTEAMLLYFSRAILYYILAITILYYGYSVSVKGRTLGRKIMKIELQGKVTWWTLLIREVIWKTGYYMLTLFIVGIVIDIFMISFTTKKKAPRDLISGITVKLEGVDYPF